jgi:hypothetical protein
MANWAFVEDGNVVEYYDSLPKNWRNITGLDLSANDLPFLRSVGWYPVQKNYTEFDSATHKQTGVEYTLNADYIVESNVVEPKTQTDLDLEDFYRREQITHATLMMRRLRDQLLTESDWTQTADMQELLSPAQRIEWKNYRQQLRDFPSIFAGMGTFNVSEIIFPPKPQTKILPPTAQRSPEVNNQPSAEETNEEPTVEDPNNNAEQTPE